MVFSVKTFNNINQIGLKELGNAFQIDGDKSDNPDAYILRSQNLHGQEFQANSKPLRGQAREPIIFLSTRQQLRELWSLTLQELMPMR